MHRHAPLLAAVALAALGGCSGGGLQVRSYAVSAVGKQHCAALLDALPATVSGKARRTTGTPFTVAWGDPAIILRCGVGAPEGFDKFSQCQNANGVDWFVPDSMITDQRADVLMTTVGRSPAIDVLVPARYRPTLGPMVDLGPALKAHTTVVKRCQ